ncbi:MAG: hypothetical protein AMXMBFR13_37110 [Phycisphaerae bacterium]
MFFDDLINSGSLPALEKTLAFTQARHRVLTENVANIDTPEYRTKHLDPQAFQRSLREAMGDRRAAGGTGPLELSGTDQVRQDADGRLVIEASEEPPENVLFHDGTNTRVERQMAMLAENAMMHQAVTELLRGRFEGLLKAIRGRIS